VVGQDGLLNVKAAVQHLLAIHLGPNVFRYVYVSVYLCVREYMCMCVFVRRCRCVLMSSCMPVKFPVPARVCLPGLLMSCIHMTA
jgi:hypothetical protein